MRFTLHRRWDCVGSTRCHGTSCRDVDGCVHVSVCGVPAGPAPERGLALARIPIHGPAARTRLRGVGGSDSLDAARSLVLKSLDKHPPPLGEDPPVQAGLGAHVPPRILDRTLGAAGHLADAEVFNADYVEPAREGGTNLLHPVLATVRGPRLQSRDIGFDPGAAVRATLCTREPALEAQQPSRLPWPQSRALHELTGRQSGGHGDPTVQSDNLTSAWTADRVRDDGEHDVPAAGAVEGDPVRLRLRRCPGETKLDPTHFRNQYTGQSTAETLHSPSLRSDDPETLVHTGLAPRRTVMRTCKEVGHCLIEIPQGLLLHCLRPGAQPSVAGSRLGQLPSLLNVPRWVTTPTPRPHGPLLKREVPHEPCVPALSQQRRFLRRCRGQTEAGHALDPITQNRQFQRKRCGPLGTPPHAEGRADLRRPR